MRPQEIVKLLRRYETPTIYSGGVECALTCPYHSKRGTRSGKKLWINLNKQVFICYKCNARGTLRSLLWQLKGVAPRQYDDVDPATIETATAKTVTQEKKDSIQLPEGYRPLWDEKDKSFMRLAARTYLKHRGISIETAEVYKLGCVTVGYPMAYRIIIPTLEKGKVIYWVARDFTNKQEQKVKNPSKAVTGVGSKECVFGLNFAEDFTSVIITEGVFSAMSVGGLNGVAIFGKTISRAQVRKILSKGFKTITILLDADAHSEALVVAEAFFKYSVRKNRPLIKVAFLKEGDPNSVPPAEVARAIDEAQQIVSTEDLLELQLGGLRKFRAEHGVYS
jgi:DNA primase